MSKFINNVKVRPMARQTFEKKILEGFPQNVGSIFREEKDKFYTCFPDVIASMKGSLTSEVSWISHKTECGDRKKKVLCVVAALDGKKWYGPKHKVGECPFCDYKKDL